MASPELLRVAERFGIPLSERTCHHDFFWDGKTLAIHYSKEEFLGDDLHLTVTQPLTPIPDFDLAHEIGHWLAASSLEREFPEYGCQQGLFYQTKTSVPDSLWRSHWLAACQLSEGVLTRNEQLLREACADFFGVWLCDRLGVPVNDLARPIYKYGTFYAKDEWIGEKAQDAGWRAIIWLFDLLEKNKDWL